METPARPRRLTYFRLASAALIAIVVLAVALVVGDPQSTTESVVQGFLVVCVLVVTVAALRAAVDVFGRADLSPQDKKVWLLWFWLGAPIAVPLYLRRAGL